MQDAKLMGDDVELAKGDLFAWLHLLRIIAKVKDNIHLKHNMNLYAKGPYLACSEDLASAISSN